MVQEGEAGSLQTGRKDVGEGATYTVSQSTALTPGGRETNLGGFGTQNCWL